jgi:hypothetical protein
MSVERRLWITGCGVALALVACGGGSGPSDAGVPDAMADAVVADALVADAGDAALDGASGDAGTDASVDSAVDSSVPLPRRNEGSPLGTNLSGIRDWVPSWPFVDVFKTSRGWISGSSSEWDDGRPVDDDAEGWVRSLAPGQIARALMLWSSTHFPEGQYIVLYDGVGTLEYRQGASRDDAASTPGRDVVDFASSGFLMNLTSTDATDPLRNIRVIMPGGVCSDDVLSYCDGSSPCGTGTCESFEDVYATQVFHPQFLSRVARYRLLRFMDWMDTNGSEQSAWVDRPKPSDARWSTHGVPVEVMVELSNRLSADAWINIPHLADDDYVTQLASYLRDNLRPDLRVYIEYSNEVWNGQFAQAGYAREQGLAASLSTNAFQAQLFYQSQRSVEIFQIFEGVFGAADRLVRVMAAQAANDWTSTQVLEFGDAGAHTDALAIAPYFGSSLGGPSERARVSAMTVDELMTELSTSTLPTSVGWIRDQAAVASAHGVALIAYEGGQHLVGNRGVENDATINALFDAGNADPRMGDLYTTYLNAWRSEGGQVFAHFTHVAEPGKFGRWGSLEYEDQARSEAPKFDALMSFIDANPAWW